jgi:O-antigen/teichoic acid export membrane protein
MNSNLESSKSSIRELGFLARHTSVYGLGIILQQLAGFLLLPLYTSRLSPADYGVLEVTGLATSLIGIVLAGGLNQALGRFYHLESEASSRSAVVATLFSLTVLSAICGFVIFSPLSTFIAQLALGDASLRQVVLLALASLSVGLVADYGLVYLRVINRSGTYISLSLLGLLISIVANILALTVFKAGVIGIFFGGLISRTLTGIVLAVIVVRDHGLRIDKARAAGIIRYSWPLIPSRLASAVISYSDRFFLSHLAGLAAVGLYALAQKIAAAIHLLVNSAFANTFEPRRFEIATRPDGPHVLAKVFEAHVFVSLLIAAGISAIAPQLFTIMAGPDFHTASRYVPLAVLCTLLYGMRMHVEFGLLYASHTKGVMYINLVVAICQIALNALLIPAFDIWGALAAQLASNMLALSLLHLASRRYYRLDYRPWWIVRAIMCALAAYVAALGIGDFVGGAFVQLLLRGLAVMAVYLLLATVLAVVPGRNIVGLLLARNKA